jgi:hypothetical protein
VALGIRCGGARGERAVEDTQLGENPHVGRRDGWGSLVCGTWPSTAPANSL